jgi:phosphohistidine phosphatase
MKNLLFMRHGKQQLTVGVNDFDLPLSDKGKKAATHKGEIIYRKGVIPDVIYSSPAMRAKTTAELVAESCGYKGEIIFDEGFYESSSDLVIKILRELPDSVNRVLLVGHNPAWAELVSKLPSPQEVIPMKPATLVALAFDSHAWKNISPGSCITEWVV